MHKQIYDSSMYTNRFIHSLIDCCHFANCSDVTAWHSELITDVITKILLLAYNLCLRFGQQSWTFSTTSTPPSAWPRYDKHTHSWSIICWIKYVVIRVVCKLVIHKRCPHKTYMHFFCNHPLTIIDKNRFILSAHPRSSVGLVGLVSLTANHLTDTDKQNSTGKYR